MRELAERQSARYSPLVRKRSGLTASTAQNMSRGHLQVGGEDETKKLIRASMRSMSAGQSKVLALLNSKDQISHTKRASQANPSYDWERCSGRRALAWNLIKASSMLLPQDGWLR